MGGDGSGEDTGEGDCVTCEGSPIVLDLGNNGFHLTSVKHGVNFNLQDYGRVRTAWVRDDDGLLVMDRNGNGAIDDGSELFGEAPALNGLMMGDGFRALELLDDAKYGGNGDCAMDAKDSLYDKLQVWNDTNRDGISQPAELRTVRQLKIQSIDLTRTVQPKAFDQHGNDLSLQGIFRWEDGRVGKVVDAFFVIAKEIVDLVSLK